LTRFFPEMVQFLRALLAPRFVLDGELAIPVGESLAFDALQLRLHPAESRIRRLAAETPSVLILFDWLMSADGRPLLDAPLSQRRTAVERFVAGQGEQPALRLSPCTEDIEVARQWLGRSGAGALDGVVAKRADEPYRPGERALVKVKRLRTAECVVGGFRY